MANKIRIIFHFVIFFVQFQNGIGSNNCPLGWSQSSTNPQLCFFFVTYQNKNWTEAVEICAYLQNNTLPILLSSSDQDAMLDRSKACSNDQYKYAWLGLYYKQSTSSYVWTDGTTATYTFWDSGQPNQQSPPTQFWGRTANTANGMHWWLRDLLPSDLSLIICQLRLSSPASATDTCAYIPTPGYQQLCSTYMTPPDNRVWTFVNSKKSWNDAWDTCNERHGRLVWPQHQADIDNLKTLTGGQPFMIGAFLTASDNNQPKWYSTATTSTNHRVLWWPNQGPTYTASDPLGLSSTGSQGCLYFSGSKYSLGDCTSANYQYVCERWQAACAPYTVSNGTLSACSVDSFVTCQSGYYLNGQDPRVCIHNSSGDFWATDAQQCQKYCSQITTGANTAITYVPDQGTGQFEAATVATVQCTGGSQPASSTGQTINCLSTGDWDATPTQCLLTCSTLSDPVNGHLSTSGPDFSIGSNATFTCDENFVLFGPSYLVCQANHQWNGTAPTCGTYCDSEPCQNGATCVGYKSGYTCQCQTGYYGINCDQTNYCITNEGQQQFHALDITDPVLQLDPVIAITANISNGTAALAAAMTSGGSSSLTAIEKTIQHFNLPTTFNNTDSCAPNGKCISGLQYAACICVSNYYGLGCTLNNCTSINWTLVATWSTWSECSVQACGSGNGIRNRTYSNFGGCTPPTEVEVCSSKDCNVPDPLSPTARVVATVAQSIGCTVLLALVGATFGLFFVLRIISLERALHMCQEISLFAGHMAIMAIMKLNLTNTNCSIVGMFLQFSFLSNFTFLALESLQTFCILQNVLSTGGFFSWLINLAIGLGLPFGLTSFTAITKFHSYRSTYSCWINFENSISFATIIPVLVLSLISIILTEAATMGDMKKLPLTSRDKYTAALVSQKGLVFTVVFNILSWTFCSWALYAQKVEIYGMVLLFNVLLGVDIMMFHTLSNDQVHRFLKSKFGRKK